MTKLYLNRRALLVGLLHGRITIVSEVDFEKRERKLWWHHG